MSPGRRPLGALMVLGLLLSGGPAGAVVVGGGGSPTTDCLTVFDAPVNFPPTRPKSLRCTDGDPNCDEDGVANGECVFSVAVCGNSTYNPTRCASNGLSTVTVADAADDGSPKFDPEFLAMQNTIESNIGYGSPGTPDDCSSTVAFHVKLDGPLPGHKCKKGQKTLKLATLSQPVQGKILVDKDQMKMRCDPQPEGCDPGVIFAGTFDRIQRQIFNRSCAVSGCHDSQSHQANLLLEVGASYNGTIDVVPVNPVAAAAGWRRIDAANASPETSFLFHKITGDLEPGMDERMPRGRPKLKAFLIDIIRLWIEAGAPFSGWVPGTDS